MNAITEIDRASASRMSHTDEVIHALGGALLTVKDVTTWTGKNRATIYRWIAAGTFPAGKMAGAGSRLWTRAEVQAWMDNRD